MKKPILAIFLAVFSMTVSAQEPKVEKEPKADSTARPAKWYENIKFSGYGMLQYQF